MASSHWWIGALLWPLVLGTLALALLLLDRFALRTPGPQADRTTAGASGWHAVPELSLLAVALPLELLWEIAQAPLYSIWQRGWGEIVYDLLHCSAGDLLILLVTFELVALIEGNRRWYVRRSILAATAFTLFGAGYTVFSEIYNVQIKAAWSYGPSMPLVPGTDIGLAPLLQWLLLPPLIVWLLRRFAPPAGAQ